MQKLQVKFNFICISSNFKLPAIFLRVHECPLKQSMQMRWPHASQPILQNLVFLSLRQILQRPLDISTGQCPAFRLVWTGFRCCDEKSPRRPLISSILNASCVSLFCSWLGDRELTILMSTTNQSKYLYHCFARRAVS